MGKSVPLRSSVNWLINIVSLVLGISSSSNRDYTSVQKPRVRGARHRQAVIWGTDNASGFGYSVESRLAGV